MMHCRSIPSTLYATIIRIVPGFLFADRDTARNQYDAENEPDRYKHREPVHLKSRKHGNPNYHDRTEANTQANRESPIILIRFLTYLGPPHVGRPASAYQLSQQQTS